jgi:hypothetical protein
MNIFDFGASAVSPLLKASRESLADEMTTYLGRSGVISSELSIALVSITFTHS